MKFAKESHQSQEELLKAITAVASALGCEEATLEAEHRNYVEYVRALRKASASSGFLSTGGDVLRELLDPGNDHSYPSRFFSV